MNNPIIPQNQKFIERSKQPIKYLAGDKNISILHLSCRTSDLQFLLVLQTHALVL